MTTYTQSDIERLEDVTAGWMNRMEIEGDSGKKYIVAQSRASRVWACSCTSYTIGWKRGNPNADPAKRSCKHLDALGLQPGSTKTIDAVIQTIGELRWNMQRLRDADSIRGGAGAKSPGEERRRVKEAREQRKQNKEMDAKIATEMNPTNPARTHARLHPTCKICGAKPGEKCIQVQPVNPVNPTPTQKTVAGVSTTKANPLPTQPTRGLGVVRALAINSTVDQLVSILDDAHTKHLLTEQELGLIMFRVARQLSGVRP